MRTMDGADWFFLFGYIFLIGFTLIALIMGR